MALKDSMASPIYPGTFLQIFLIPWPLRIQNPSFLSVPYPLVYGKTILTQDWCKYPSEDAWMNATSKCSSTSIFEQALVPLGNSKVTWPLMLLCGCTNHHRHHIFSSTTSHLVAIKPNTHRKVALAHKRKGSPFMLASSRSHPFKFNYPTKFTFVW